MMTEYFSRFDDRDRAMTVNEVILEVVTSLEYGPVYWKRVLGAARAVRRLLEVSLGPTRTSTSTSGINR